MMDEMVQPARQKETTKEDSADQEEDLHWLTSLARSIPNSPQRIRQ